MSDMMRRCISAVLCSQYPEGCARSYEENGRLIVSPSMYDDAKQIVYAVLNELREPTSEMMYAGATLEPDMKGALIVTPNGARDVLRAMIDRALDWQG